MKQFPMSKETFERFKQETTTTDGKSKSYIVVVRQGNFLDLMLDFSENSMIRAKGVVQWMGHARTLDPPPLCGTCDAELDMKNMGEGVPAIVVVSPQKEDFTAMVIMGLCPTCSAKHDLEIARAVDTWLHDGHAPSHVGVKGMN